MSDKSKIISNLEFLEQYSSESYKAFEILLNGFISQKGKVISDNYKLTEKIQDYYNRLTDKESEIKLIKEKYEKLESKFNRAMVLMSENMNYLHGKSLKEIFGTQDITPGMWTEYVSKWRVNQRVNPKFDQRKADYYDSVYLKGLCFIELYYESQASIRDS